MSQNEKTPFYITTAIAYASRKPHIGNTYEAIATDAIARYKRMRGYDVRFMTGTDEHGQKIEECAKEKGVSPQAYVDEVSGEIKKIWDLMNVSYDRFIRTTEPEHERVVQHIFKKLYDKGDIYKNNYEGWYCVPCESFYTETQVGEEHICPDCGRPVTKTKEEAYFFRMSAYQDRLLQYIEDHPEFIEPESRKKEMVNNFLKTGLQDLCVSRTSFTWGVPVDFDPKHVVYVWIDALSNYITGLGYDIDTQSPLFEKYWPADVHVIGKDIMRFHTIYWPIILMALDLPLPKKIFGHPWFLFGNDKMSKSKGNVLYADQLASLFGVDGVRHYCLCEMPYANDGNITIDNMITRYNTDLANNLGNLVSRTIAMTKKYFNGVVPAPTSETTLDLSLQDTCCNCRDEMFAAMDNYHVADAEEAVFALFRRANKYIDETTPWALAKDPEQQTRLGTVLYNLLEAIRFGATILSPFLPATAEQILTQLGTTQTEAMWGKLEPNTVLNGGAALFARINADELYQALDLTNEHTKENPEQTTATTNKTGDSAGTKKGDGAQVPGVVSISEITYDDFMRVELRTAQVVACKPVPKADKLLKLQLDLGYEQRQVVSGIAACYKPEDMVGKKVIVVCNLAPRKLRGEVSNGMILASGEEQIRVVFLSDDTPLGERVR